MASELDIQKELTAAFIATSPIELVLTPYGRTETPTGGYIEGALPARPMQTFKLIQLSENADPVLGQDGIMRRMDFTLLGLWDAEIAVRDRFSYKGGDFTVEALMMDLEYETRALVRRCGE